MTDTPGNNRETELKLALAPDQVAPFLRLMARRRQTPTRQRLVTRYYDTPDFALNAVGVALRVRRQGRRWVQTLKTEGERHGGLSVRAEYETPLAHGALDCSRLPEEAQALVPQELRDRLTPVFETDFKRTAWLIRTRQGAHIEVALDVGEVRAGERVLPLCEVELELKAGRVDALYAVAIALSEKIDPLPLDASKAERGALLARSVVSAPLKAANVALARGMSVEDAFAAICSECLRQIQANLPGCIAGNDPEYLHQARVAQRRLRAGLRLFRKVCPLPPGELQAGLRMLAAALGPARDWDVLCLQTLPATAPHYPDQDAWRALADAAESQRCEARQAMLAGLRQLKPGRWLLQFHRWLRLRGWRENTALDTPGGLPRFSRQALKRGLRDIRRLGRNFGQLSAAERHALRIAIKRQRYAAEFFRALLPRACDKYIAGLTRAQDTLGVANDARIASDLLHRLGNADCLHAQGFAQGWLARQTLDAPGRKFAKQWQDLMKSSECW